MEKEKNVYVIEDENYLLLEFLYQKLPYPKKKTKSLLVHGNISVNDQIVTKYNHVLQKGDVVRIQYGKMVADQKGEILPILYEDSEFIVINKPSGLLTVATMKEKEKTAYRMVKEHVQLETKKNQIFVLHRLDQETSGVLVFVKKKLLKEKLQEDWNHLVLTREYITLVEGIMEKECGTRKSYLKENKIGMVVETKNKKDGKLAITYYETIKKKGNETLLRVWLETGRKNQIRVHMKAMGHPIVGDKKYGIKESSKKRLALHASKLEFIHPITHKKYSFHAPIPEELRGEK